VRLKIACRNLKRIPQERLFEMAKKLYLVSILVEDFEQGGRSDQGGDSDGDYLDDNDGAGDAGNNDGDDDNLLDGIHENMDADKNAGSKF
jgi:hypothetical protein